MANIAFHTATTGVMEHQKALDTLANNISNVNTYGFKASDSSFEDLLYTNVDGAAEKDVTVGHGARLSKNDNDFSQGPLAKTGRSLDFAFEKENAFFQVVTANGNTEYTRNGNFSLREYGDGFLLVSSELNGYVTDSNGKPIFLNGSTDDDMEGLDQKIGKFSFANLDGVVRNDNGSFSPSVASGEPYASDAGLKQKYLEASNVNYADAITDVMKVQRAYQMNARMLTITDEIVDTINGLK